MKNEKAENLAEYLETCMRNRVISESFSEVIISLTKAEEIFALLKEQVQKEIPMTMERISVVKVDGNDFYKGFCPVCQTLQYGIKSKYCDQCGQAVKWE